MYKRWHVLAVDLLQPTSHWEEPFGLADGIACQEDDKENFLMAILTAKASLISIHLPQPILY